MVLTVLMVLFAAVIDAFFGPKAGSLCNAPVFRESDGEALENVNLDSKEGKSNG